ncbi:MAG: hypothetical protein KGZ63_12845 [Clostridiales bacterium]|jgi:hypothetical protein|nr:hypothetical protein [Clostridiales bacterium]
MENMFFVSEQHKENYKIFHRRLYSSWSKEYKAAAYILAHPELFSKCQKYFTERGFNALALFKNEKFSSSYTMLVKLAHNLFSGKNYRNCSFRDLLGTLDDSNCRVMGQAVQLLRPSYICF